jgi:hypothetical protein
MDVTRANYVEAETDRYMVEQQAMSEVNVFSHNPPVDRENQIVIRSNRDVMYSTAVVDVSDGATFTVPDSGRFQIIHAMDEFHLTHAVIRAGESRTLTVDDLTGGSYVYLLSRTQIGDDLEEAVEAQRAMRIDAASSNPYVGKGWDEADVLLMREQLVNEYVEGKATIKEHLSFGATLDDVDPESYLYAAAVGWGGLPSHTAQYLPKVTGQGSAAPQQLTIPKPDLRWEQHGFFSLTTYDTAGWIVEEDFYIDHKRMRDDGDSYTFFLNVPNEPASITVAEGWTGVLRFYLPRHELDFIEYIDSLRSIAPQPI